MEKSITAKKNSSLSASSKGVKKMSTKKASNSQESESSMLMNFFVDELRDIYWAEKHLIKTLPKMQKAASSSELQQAFSNHLEMTREHVSRLEQAFETLGKKAQGKKCEAMEGITKEGEGIIEETQKGTATRDVALIMAAQKVEHYEIATYGGLVQLAKTIGQNEIATTLGTTLSEEKETDQLLTDIAENNINYQATQEVEGDGEGVEASTSITGAME